ncbi:sugar-transfer associated ATP-grasp domain-containing protein [Thalassovita sp.]|uniref:sugar-transfer associated ATP-grasp domain-containing protein n=1 Tax=Thalassovita sp. TaxID=1979401 RepID=UPI0029DE760C|nr:sugar-transfer associated ATP-grasp domain-containing protein [Thalassovita sp.]
MKKFPLSHTFAILRGYRPWVVARYAEPAVADLSRFLNFLERRKLCDNTNRAVSSLVNNKLFFAQALGPWQHLVPQNFCYLEGGQCYDLRGGGFDPVPLEQVIAQEGGRFVLKPVGGTRSRGVHFVSMLDGQLLADGQPTDAHNVQQLADPVSGSILCRCLQQHPDVSAIFPDALMTLRILTYYDDALGRGRILGGFARIGTNATAPFEAASKGGLQAQIDFETGTLHGAITFAPQTWWSRPQRSYLDVHPDTGGRIKGMRIPHWDDLHATLQQMIDALPIFQFTGWDFAITPDAFAVIEANDRPGTDTIQYFRPLLDDAQFRDFLIRHRMIRR